MVDGITTRSSSPRYREKTVTAATRSVAAVTMFLCKLLEVVDCFLQPFVKTDYRLPVQLLFSQ